MLSDFKWSYKNTVMLFKKNSNKINHSKTVINNFLHNPAKPINFSKRFDILIVRTVLASKRMTVKTIGS